MASLGLHVDRSADLPLGTQLAWQIQALITSGRLQAGERLPSVRRLAEVVGVNVNTIRSVYDRLEGEGFVNTQHGRGSYVAESIPQVDPRALATRQAYAGTADVDRRDLREQIAGLEAELSAHVTEPPPTRRSEDRPRILTNEELAQVRDELVDRLAQLDAMRDDLVEMLASLRTAMGEPDEAAMRKKPHLRATHTPRPAQT